MGEAPGRVRLRQAVLAAGDIEPVLARLQAELALAEPFRDPGVAEFGLCNAVFTLGDCFLEVVSPTRPGTAAGRHLRRHGGDGGYMLLFAVEDLDGARERACELGVRSIWQIELPDISATHLHPADMRGAIVSIDRPRPYGSWRWGGPAWTARAGDRAPGGLLGATLEVADPQEVAARWAHVLGLAPPAPGAEPVLALDGGSVRFRAARTEPESGLVEIAVLAPQGALAGAEELVLGSLSVHLERGPAAAMAGAP